MATVSAPRGLKPIALLGGMPFAGSTQTILIKSGYATAIFNGDVVGFADVTNSKAASVATHLTSAPFFLRSLISSSDL